MPVACYGGVVSAIQVKNVPPDLHQELRRRAAAEGKTVGEVILESLRRDLRRQSMQEWMDRVLARAVDIPKIGDEEFQRLIEESDRDMWGGDDDGA
jgi:plasmid stability protein